MEKDGFDFERPADSAWELFEKTGNAGRGCAGVSRFYIANERNYLKNQSFS